MKNWLSPSANPSPSRKSSSCPPTWKRKTDSTFPPDDTRFEDILEDPDIDVIVEVTGAFEDGLRYMRSSLEKGIPVVTANKSVVSAHMESLLTLAKEKETPFLYEAAVGGAIPILKPLKEEILLNRIDEIEGILNGTANYILTRMFEGS